MNLAEAIRSDDLEALGKAIKRTKNLNKDMAGGERPLTVAARGGFIKAMRALMAAGADPHNTGYNSTALSDAADAGQVEAVKALLEGLNFSAQELTEAASAAARKRHLAVLQALRQKNAPLEKAMEWAVRGGFTDLVKWLLEAGVSANLRLKDGQGERSLLHLAASSGLAAPVPILLAAGADVNARDSQGRTALMVAAESEPLMNAEQMRFREQRKEALRTGQTRWTVPSGDEADFLVIDALLDGGADASLVDNDGHDAMQIFLAESKDDLEMEADNEWLAMRVNTSRRVHQRLSEAGAGGGKEADQQLLEAAQKGDVARIKRALSAGANVNARFVTHGAHNALAAAASGNHVQAMRTLLDAGIRPDDGGKSTSPLIVAANEDHLEAAKLLVEAGADVNLLERSSAKSENPYNALVYATIRGHRKMVKYLRSVGAKLPQLPIEPFKPGVDFPDSGSEVLVKAPVKKTAGALAKLIGGRAIFDAWGKTLRAGPRSYAVIQLKGSQWASIVAMTQRSRDEEAWSSLARDLSKQCAAPAAVVSYSDVSGHSGYELYERGERSERFVQGDEELAGEMEALAEELGEDVPRIVGSGLFESRRGRKIDPDGMQDGAKTLAEIAHAEGFRALVYAPIAEPGKEFDFEIIGFRLAVAEAAYVSS